MDSVKDLKKVTDIIAELTKATSADDSVGIRKARQKLYDITGLSENAFDMWASPIWLFDKMEEASLDGYTNECMIFLISYNKLLKESRLHTIRHEKLINNRIMKLKTSILNTINTWATEDLADHDNNYVQIEAVKIIVNSLNIASHEFEQLLSKEIAMFGQPLPPPFKIGDNKVDGHMFG